MKKHMLLFGAALLFSSCAGRPFTATKYRPAGLIGGYSESEIEPGIWRVSGRSNGIAEQGFGRNMAMYRAAEIMRDMGFTEFHIIDQKGKTTTMRQGYGGVGSFAGEELSLLVVGTQLGVAPPPCRAENAAACFNVAVEPTMQRLAPLLYIKPEAPLTVGE